jgi:hypothetical protein
VYLGVRRLVKNVRGVISHPEDQGINLVHNRKQDSSKQEDECKLEDIHFNWSGSKVLKGQSLNFWEKANASLSFVLTASFPYI